MKRKFKSALLAILTMAVLCSFTVADECKSYIAYEYSVADVNDGIYTWYEWRKCRVEVVFNYTKDQIYIDSSNPQLYAIISDSTKRSDGKGGIVYEWTVIDQDHDRGSVRLRINPEYNQLYVDFDNIAWVYNFY